MKSICIFLLLTLMCFSVLASELLAVTALNGKVSLLKPIGFSAMSQEMIDVKYPSKRQPTEILTNESGSVNLAFNHTPNRMGENEIREAREVFSEMFHNLYPSATWLRDEVISQNGSDFIVFELVTPALDTKIHNIMYGTSVDDRFLLVAFNTTIEKSDEWLPIGKKMMESLKLN